MNFVGGKVHCYLIFPFQRQVSGKSNSADLTYPGIIESTEEYKFVERLIPPTTVPVPPKHDQYPTPSGWRPPQGKTGQNISKFDFLNV